MSKQVIGVTGFRRCGKNTITNYLNKHFAFRQYAFADALRAIASAVDPMISMKDVSSELRSDLCEGDSYGTVSEYVSLRYNEIVERIGYERSKAIPDFRRFLQRLGTEGIRATFGPNAWVKALERQVLGEDKVAISDVRFHSEADWVHKQGGVLWRVITPGVGGDDPHPSEVDIPNLPADREILNARSLEDLEAAVIAAAEEDLPTLPRFP